MLPKIAYSALYVNMFTKGSYTPTLKARKLSIYICKVSVNIFIYLG